MNRGYLTAGVNQLFNIYFKESDIDLVKIHYEKKEIEYLLPIRSDSYSFSFAEYINVEEVIHKLILDIENNLESMEQTIRDALSDVYKIEEKG